MHFEQNVEPEHERAQTRGVILLADDDDDVRLILALRFAQIGYDVGTASNGAEMIELLESSVRPTAIFVDLMMPGVLGTSVLEYLQSQPRLSDVPTAIVTGTPERAPPGYRVFTKPARFDSLREFVQDASSTKPDNS